MSEYQETNHTQSSFLDQQAIEAALTYITDCWPNHPMTVTIRESWVDILCQLHPGELKAALAQKSAKFRPDAYAVLEVVLESRRAVEQQKRWEAAEANANHMRDLAKEQSTPEAKTAHELVMEQHRNLVEAHRARKRAGERKFRLNSEVTEPKVEAS